MHHEASSGIIVYRRNNGTVQFLLLERREGFLDFPKGHIEQGENEAESAIRETREETGLELKPEGRFRYEQEYWYTRSGEKVRKTVTMFLAQAEHDAEVNVSFEHEGYRWLGFYEAIQGLSYKNQRRMLQAAMAEIMPEGS